MTALHPRVREKVELEEPKTYQVAVKFAKAKRKKLKKKLEQGVIHLEALPLPTPPRSPPPIEERIERVDPKISRALNGLSHQLQEL